MIVMHNVTYSNRNTHGHYEYIAFHGLTMTMTIFDHRLLHRANGISFGGSIIQSRFKLMQGYCSFCALKAAR